MDKRKILDLNDTTITIWLQKLSDSERDIFWQRVDSMDLDGVAVPETIVIEAIQRIIGERVIKGKCDICERVDGCLLTTGQRPLCGGPYKW
jgi:hypothetical protein